MDRRLRNSSGRFALRTLLAVLLTTGVVLEGHAEPPPEKDWEIELLPYAWLPNLDVSLETRRGTERAEASASEILRDVQLGAMGRLSARWKRWLLVADGLWVKLEQEDGVRRGPFRLDAEVDLDLALVQGFVGRRLYSRPGGLFGQAASDDERTFGFDVLAGFDYVDISMDVEIDLTAGVSLAANERKFRVSESWVSPAIGLRMLNDFTPRIRLEMMGTLGGFAVGDAPDRTWQLTTLLSYRFTDHWLVSVGHRLFDADDGSFEVRTHGAMLGVGFRL